MRITQSGSHLILGIVIVSLFFVACSNHKDIVAVNEAEDTVNKTIKIKESNDKNNSLIVKLTPIEECKKEKDSYNLIVDVPFNARVRILNIKPIYRDCIPLEKGKYHIEVTKIGFEKYKIWIDLDSDTALDIKLQKINVIDRSQEEKYELEKAGYSSRKLHNFIKRYPNSLMAHTAKKRINRIKKSFRNYSPHSLIKSNDCIGFYPKSLVDKTLKITTSVSNWNSIKWSGSCKNELMFGRGVLYFDSDKGVHVELKGKMKNGFFEGRIYNSSNLKNKIAVKGNSSGHHTVKLKNRFDFKQYQD